MRVVLTGAAGFVGAATALSLLEQGHAVLAVIRPTSETKRVKALTPRMDVLSADLDDADAVRAGLRAFRPEIAVHLAWYANPRDYLHSPENIPSLATTIRFFENSVAAGCRRFVGLGTCLEYADSAVRREEAHPTDPISLYASAKLSACHILRSLARRDAVEFAWARLFHVHGRGESADRLLPAIVRSLRAGQAFRLTSGVQMRDHLSVDDVAGGLAFLAGSSAGGVFNLCSGEPVSLREVVATLGEIEGRPDLLRFGALPFDEATPRFLVGDPSRLRDLGWRPLLPSLRAGLESAYRDPA